MPLSQQEQETIKQKIVDFWVSSYEKLKLLLTTEKDTEKLEVLVKQEKYLAR